MTKQQDDVIKQITEELLQDTSIPEDQKAQLLRNLTKLQKSKIHLLIVGATGCGKSSTINALFQCNKAKVGQGVEPETMTMEQYELNNLVIFDSPGLGDGKEADLKHAKNITEVLLKTDDNGDLLIDLVLVILDGGSRDLGTSFELINQVIIPNLGEDKSRLLVAINQADMAMKGRHWDHQNNCPDPTLKVFLDDKVRSTEARIFEATKVKTTPIYYSAGYKDGDEVQQPYNLTKLFAFIVRHTKSHKRAVFSKDLNHDPQLWVHGEDLKQYQQEIQQSLWESIMENASDGGDWLGEIGDRYLGRFGEIVGKGIGALGGGIWGGLKSIVGRWF